MLWCSWCPSSPSGAGALWHLRRTSELLSTKICCRNFWTGFLSSVTRQCSGSVSRCGRNWNTFAFFQSISFQSFYALASLNSFSSTCLPCSLAYLGAFASRKATIRYSRQPVRPHETTQLPLERDNWHADQYTFLIMSRPVLLRMRNVSDQSFTEIQISRFTFSNVFVIFDNPAVYEIMWKNVVEPDKPLMTIWRMRFACWI